MDDSISPTPKEIPAPSISPTPSSALPDPGAASPPPSSTAARKKTSRRKTTRRRSRKKTSGRGVERTEASRKSGARKPPADAPPPIAAVTEDDVKVALRESGEIVHGLLCSALNVEPQEWPEIGTFTDQDLKEIAPPAARIVNKHAALARVVEQSDEIVVSLKLGRWVMRTASGAAAARRLEDVTEEQQREEPAKVARVSEIGSVGPSGPRSAGGPAHGREGDST